MRPRETSVCISVLSFIFYHINDYRQAVPSENENGTTGNLNQTRALVGKASKFKTTIVPKRSTHDTDLVKAEAVANSANSALIDQIGSATRFRDLPSTITNSAALKQFRSTCFHGWMASDNLFEDFTKDSDVLLNIVRTAFTKAFPDLAYVPCCKDVFHHTVSPDLCSLTCSL